MTESEPQTKKKSKKKTQELDDQDGGDKNNNNDKDDDNDGNDNTSKKVGMGGGSGVVTKTYEERVLSQPLASKKITKKAHKLVKKASQAKIIRRGVKEVVKGLRKGEHGLAILAGDIYPIDVYSFLPISLEEKSIPYLFVPSKQDLGAAAGTKRPTSVVLMKQQQQPSSSGSNKDINNKDPLRL